MAEPTETRERPTRAYVIHPDLGNSRTRRSPELALEEAIALAHALPAIEVVGAEVAKLQKPVHDAAPDAPSVDPVKLAADMRACADLDKLYELAGLMEVVTDEAAAMRINEIFAAKQAELEQG